MRTILFALALLVAGVAFAGEPSTIVLKTKVHGLPPNTRITLEMRAKYSLIDFSNVRAKGGAHSASPGELFVLASSDVFRWDVTTDARGTAPARVFRFRFNRELEEAPPELDAVLSFPTTYKVVCPPGLSSCTSREETLEYMTAFVEKTAQVHRCLEIYQGQGVGVGINKDCSGFQGKGYVRVPGR